MKIRHLALSATALFVAAAPSNAQSVLLDWDDSWDYYHPTRGALPRTSGGVTLHRAGTTPWFADQQTFDASYTGPSFTTPSTGFDVGNGPGPIG